MTKHEHHRYLTKDELAELRSTGDVWAECPSYPAYEASFKGRIRSWRDVRFPDGREMFASNRMNIMMPDGHFASKNPGQLVADAFLVEKPSKLHTLCHIDGDSTNNQVYNLCWESRSEVRLRSYKQLFCKRQHPLSGPNLRISTRGSRVCKTCNNAAVGASKLRKRLRKKGLPFDHVTTDYILDRREELDD